MLSDSSHTDLLIEEKSSGGRKLIAVLCAILVTVGFIAGYAYLRKRHSQQMLASAGPAQQPQQTVRKGPAKAHILVDDALMKAGQSIIGGTVKNISSERLTSLAVSLELRRRKDAVIEQLAVNVEPPDLEPGQEGRYALTVQAQQYLSVRLVGLKAGSDSAPLSYTTSPGQKRAPERLEPRIVIGPRTGSRGGDFLNSPDNPARVP